MVELILYLIQNPEEAVAIATGKAIPLGLSQSEIGEVIQLFSNTTDNVGMTMGYWM